jgi:hypothetical protein
MDKKYLPNLIGNRERRSCGYKRRYSSRGSAVKDSNKIAKKEKKKTTIYFCQFCHYWHIGRIHGSTTK